MKAVPENGYLSKLNFLVHEYDIAFHLFMSSLI